MYKKKTDDNNTIKKIKESWNEEELKQEKEIFLTHFAECFGLLSSNSDIKDFNDWIKENL